MGQIQAGVNQLLLLGTALAKTSPELKAKGLERKAKRILETPDKFTPNTTEGAEVTRGIATKLQESAVQTSPTPKRVLAYGESVSEDKTLENFAQKMAQKRQEELQKQKEHEDFVYMITEGGKYK